MRTIRKKPRRTAATLQNSCLAFKKYLGNSEAAAFQLARGYEVSALNQRKLLLSPGATVGTVLAAEIGSLERAEWRGPSFEAEFGRLVNVALHRSEDVQYDGDSLVANEPLKWLADLRGAAVEALARGAEGECVLRDGVRRLLHVMHTSYSSAYEREVDAQEEKVRAQRARKGAKREAQQVFFGGFTVPDRRSSLASAVFDAGDFDAEGELLADSDCDEPESAWRAKCADYCELKRSGPAMDLKGRSPLAVEGAPLVVFYEEGGLVPYRAAAICYDPTPRPPHSPTPGLWVRFENGSDVRFGDDKQEMKITDEDEWRWL